MAKARAKPGGTMTPKRVRFVEEYLVDLNGKEAAIRAGYSSHTAASIAHELLLVPVVAEAVAAGRKALAERTEVNAEYVVGVIRETIERCRQAVRPLLDDKGEQVLVEDRDGKLCPAYAFDAKSVLKGAELLGRHVGIFKDADKGSSVGVLNLQINL